MPHSPAHNQAALKAVTRPECTVAIAWGPFPGQAIAVRPFDARGHRPTDLTRDVRWQRAAAKVRAPLRQSNNAPSKPRKKTSDVQRGNNRDESQTRNRHDFRSFRVISTSAFRQLPDFVASIWRRGCRQLSIPLSLLPEQIGFTQAPYKASGGWGKTICGV